METDFGAWLEGKLDEQDRSQKEVAIEAGVSERTLSQWKTNPRRAKIRNLNALAETLNVSRKEVYEAAGRMADYRGEAPSDEQYAVLQERIRRLRRTVEDVARGLDELEALMRRR